MLLHGFVETRHQMFMTKDKTRTCECAKIEISTNGNRLIKRG
jgi:hypothetical protein